MRYAKRLLVTLDPLLRETIDLPSNASLEEKIERGCLLLAGAGQGKTTLLQIVSSKLVKRYLNGVSDTRLPVLFSLRRWLPDQKLDEALHLTVNMYCECSKRAFRRFLTAGQVCVLLDGHDEIWSSQLPFDSEVRRLRDAYPRVIWTITSRSDRPSPKGFGDTASLPSLSVEEMADLRRGRRRNL
jgi:hypothetical protein